MTVDDFHSHLIPEVEVLERNKLLKLVVPSNCINYVQSLVLSVNKALKNHLVHPFAVVCTRVCKKLQQGANFKCTSVDKQLSVKLVSASDYLCVNPQICINGFKKADC